MFRLSAKKWNRVPTVPHDRIVRTYREIFAVPEFRILFLARCTTMAAVAMEGLALATLVYDLTGSTVLTALSLFGGPLITLVGSATILGANDAMGPRRATLLMPLAYAISCAVQVIPDLPVAVRFLLLAFPYLVGSATSGSTMRLLHLIVPPDGFLLGRATLNIAVGVMQVVGYALGGLLLRLFSPSTLFAIAAVLALLTAVVVRFGITERPATQSATGLVARTRAVNRTLLGSRTTLPLYLAMWVPNGLIVGCEALYVPYASHGGSGFMFAAAAAGMLLGDVLIGRVIPPPRRDGMIEPLRLLLAVPYLGMVFAPSLPVAVALAFVASVGYAASLPLQERLVEHTDDDVRGQVFGLYGSGLMVGQAVGAAIGGAVAEVLSPAHTMGVLAAVSVAISLALTVPLRASAPAATSSPSPPDRSSRAPR